MTTDGGDRSFGAPRFDVVLRGYDRRQVDEHLSRLQRVLSRMRGDLEAARGQPAPAVPAGTARRPPAPHPAAPAGRDARRGGARRRRHLHRPHADDPPGGRGRGRRDPGQGAGGGERASRRRTLTARAEEEKARATLANLVRQRDAVLADLTRVRGQLEALLSGPTARITLPTQDATTAAAARRDAGAGHPLPGTPASPPKVEPGSAGAVEADAGAPGKPGSAAGVSSAPGAGAADTAGSRRRPALHRAAGRPPPCSRSRVPLGPRRTGRDSAAAQPGAPRSAHRPSPATAALPPRRRAPLPMSGPGRAERAPADRATGSPAEQTVVMAPGEASTTAASVDDARADDPGR